MVVRLSPNDDGIVLNDNNIGAGLAYHDSPHQDHYDGEYIGNIELIHCCA